MRGNETPRWLTYSVPLQRLFVRIGVLPFLLVIALIVFSAMSARFFTSENLITVARQATYLAIVAMGQMLALLTGGFDLSVGKIVAITSVDNRADHGAACCGSSRCYRHDADIGHSGGHRRRHTGRRR